MDNNYSVLAEMPLETLVSTTAGRQLLGNLIATENLDAEVNQHLDLLDIPEEMRQAITAAVISKRALMLDRDTDAQLLFRDPVPGIQASIDLFANKSVLIDGDVTSVENVPSIS